MTAQELIPQLVAAMQTAIRAIQCQSKYIDPLDRLAVGHAADAVRVLSDAVALATDHATR
jgi:hypothetical protein